MLGRGRRGRRLVQWLFSDEAKVESYKRFDLPNGGYLIAQITSMKNEGLSSVQDASFTAVPKVRNQKKAQIIIKENKTIKSLSDLASKYNTEIKKALALNQKNATISGAGREPLLVGYAFGLELNEISDFIIGENGVYKLIVTKREKSSELENYKPYANQLLVPARANVINGVFQSAKSEFLDIVQDLGMLQKSTSPDISFYRHPLAYLVEAADDICYTIIDFEDGINLGLIEEEYALEYLINLVRDRIDSKKYHSLQHTKDRVSYLRALAINTLINQAVQIFLDNEESILTGNFDKSLLEKCSYEAQINDIIKISVDKIYKSQEVLEKEVAGYRIIADLLHVFVSAVNNKYDQNYSNYDQLILNLLPKEYQSEDASLYNRIMQICTYVSRMSDRYAIRTHQKLTGNII